MPVDSTHPDYDANVFAWWRAREVFAGEDAIKAAGERYLPRLDAQSDDEYAAYKTRASFFNATARTAQGLLGLMFHKAPTIKLPDDGLSPTTLSRSSAGQFSPERRGSSMAARALAEFVNDADLLGTRLTAYAKNLAEEVILVGRAGTLVDWSPDAGRAYAACYTAEQILNWRVERVNGRQAVTMVVLRETAEGQSSDDFESGCVEQIRVLRLVQAGPANEDGSRGRSPHRMEDGAHGVTRPTEQSYVVEIWRRSLRAANAARGRARRMAKGNWELIEIRTPLRRGKPLPLIPFMFHGPRHCQSCVDKLPLADIIAVNLDHYRLNADYKHGLHFTALPTAWVSGFDKAANLRIGSSTAWVTETPGATAGFLEFTGQGLTTFERAMDRDERLMAILGSRMLEEQKRVGETAQAIELRQTSENSVLMTLALSVSDSVSHVLRWIYWWNSTEASPETISEDLVLLQLNTDFSAKGLASDELTAIVAAWQAGAISRETMFDLFRRGEVLPPGRTDEEEARLASGTSNNQPPTSNTESGNGTDGTNRINGKGVNA